MKHKSKASVFPAHLVIRSVGLLCVLTGGLFGIFAAMGLCAAIWGGGVLDTTLSAPHPDRSHPASWIFPLIMVPAMLIGFAGTMFACYFPLCVRWSVVLSGHGPVGQPILRWLLYYASALKDYCTREIARLEGR